MTYLVWARESKGPCRQPGNVEIRHIKALLNVPKDPGQPLEVDSSKKKTFWQI